MPPARRPASASGAPARSRSTPFLVSFDVYGTLVDVRGGSRDAFATILREAGASHVDALEFWEHWEAANIRHYWRPYRPYRDICRASLEETFRHFAVRGDSDLIGHYFDAFPRFRRFPDVDETLDRLVDRVRLAIVSNIDDDLLAATDLGRRFDVVCTAERARGYKPNGTLFRFVLTHGDASVTRLLHCGQSQHTDMVGAKPLGVRVAWINRRGLALAPGVPKPDHELRDLRGVPELLPSELD
jgi:2-haloacid dehalogenase